MRIFAKLGIYLLLSVPVNVQAQSTTLEATTRLHHTQSVQPSPNQAPKPPLMGLSTWNAYRANINDSIIRALADAMVTIEEGLAIDKLIVDMTRAHSSIRRLEAENATLIKNSSDHSPEWSIKLKLRAAK